MNKDNYLYRHFDGEGNLLYVGISIDPIKRLKDHSVAAHWFSKIKSVTIEEFESRNLVIDAEKNAIKNENPIYNIMRYKEKHLSKKQEKEQDKFQVVQQSKDRLTRQIIFGVTYSLKDVSLIFGVTTLKVNQWIDDKKLNAIFMGERKFGVAEPKKQYIVTGWQLMDFIDYMEKLGYAP